MQRAESSNLESPGAPRIPPGALIQLRRAPVWDPNWPKWAPRGSKMLSDDGFLLHILHVMLPQPSCNQISSNLKPFHPSKSSIFIERVINFEVFRILIADALLYPFCSQFWTLGTSSWELWGSFWRPLGASWDVLGPLGAKCSRHV